MKIKYRELLLLPVLAFLFFVSFLTANAVYEYKERNDLLVYADYVGCLQSNSILSCSEFISSSGEYFFYLVAYLFSALFVEFSHFILVYSFLIYSSVAILVASLSSRNGFLVYFMSISFLLTDFRFYDLANNVLRHGLAVLMMMLFLYQYTKFGRSRFVYLTSALPILSHISSIGHLFIFFRKKIFDNGFVLFGIIVALFLFNGLFEFLIKSNVFPGYITGKLYYYYINSDGYSDWLPSHYYLILLFSLILSVRDNIYLVVRKVFFGYVFLSIIFVPLDMSYRFVSFMTPLVSVMVGYQFQYVCSLVKEKFLLKSIIFALFVIYLIFIVVKNYEYLVKGF